MQAKIIALFLATTALALPHNMQNDDGDGMSHHKKEGHKNMQEWDDGHEGNGNGYNDGSYGWSGSSYDNSGSGYSGESYGGMSYGDSYGSGYDSGSYDGYQDGYNGGYQGSGYQGSGYQGSGYQDGSYGGSSWSGSSSCSDPSCMDSSMSSSSCSDPSCMGSSMSSSMSSSCSDPSCMGSSTSSSMSSSCSDPSCMGSTSSMSSSSCSDPSCMSNGTIATGSDTQASGSAVPGSDTQASGSAVPGSDTQASGSAVPGSDTQASGSAVPGSDTQAAGSAVPGSMIGGGMMNMAGTMVNMSSVKFMGTGQGDTMTVIVAPQKGVLRFVPSMIWAQPGTLVNFVWGAGPHTVAKSNINTGLCNATMDGTNFNTGQQVAGFQFQKMINDTNPTSIYCSVPNHCQKGMFMIINPPNVNASEIMQAQQVAMNAGQSLPSQSSQGQSLLSIPQYPQNWLNPAATQWSGMAPWVAQDMVSNMAYTNAFLAAGNRIVNNTAFPQVQAPVGSTTAFFANTSMMNATMNGTMPNSTAVQSASSAPITSVQGLAVGIVAVALSAFLAL